ncbi:MAG: hypothetical protein GTO29_10250 [Candidatus Latescibacteria bacterium]|nr:hypothetical protein [Candidatus Latescibacterota bacterium]NIO56542.1 hypothetical protein [Candidatus Latescibacterota bacterium]
MNGRKTKAAQLAVFGFVTFLVISAVFSAPAGAQAWPAFFDPNQLLTLNLQMDPADWDTVQNDLTFDIAKPAWFWLDGEDSILVGVRRKSCDALGGSPHFLKVSLKIDINEYVPAQIWHSLKKLSLENGDDVDVVSEGFSWYLHELATYPDGYGYTHSAGNASWVKLYINGYYTGVYINTEQRDKQFMRNRLLYISGETWLYKNVSDNVTRLEFGFGNSPTYQALCYQPFADTATCPTPDFIELSLELPELINMQAMLTMAAVNMFAQNDDGLFMNGRNSYFIDFLSSSWLRMYFPWDLDASINSGVTEIYPSGSEYSDTLLAAPMFRNQYTEIMLNLLSGPFAEANLIAFLNATEALLTEALEADPNNQMVSVPGRFDELRSWVPVRRAQAYSQLDDLTGVMPSPDVERISFYYPSPNPSRTTTRMGWAMPSEAPVRLQVFDVTGRLVATLVDERRMIRGEHGVIWNGLNRYGHRVPAGVYFARIEAGPWSSVRKIVRLRHH